MINYDKPNPNPNPKPNPKPVPPSAPDHPPLKEIFRRIPWAEGPQMIYYTENKKKTSIRINFY